MNYGVKVKRMIDFVLMLKLLLDVKPVMALGMETSDYFVILRFS